jgi:protein-tyrosine kinase
MDQIRQAVDRARSAPSIKLEGGVIPAAANATLAPLAGSRTGSPIKLDARHLESARIVAHLATNPHSRAFDMLRTQTLQSLETNGWQFLAITSPTPACGKTVTAINLAFSIARQPERSVLLVDLDVQKPRVAEYLGFKFDHGLIGALEGRVSLREATTEVGSGPYNFSVLPCEGHSPGSSEWMASQAMTNVLQAIRREFRSHIVVFDMPPILLGDDVISVLPKMDAVLLIGGAGTTSLADIKECNKHLQSANVLRIVVNKVSEAATPYYGYGAYG